MESKPWREVNREEEDTDRGGGRGREEAGSTVSTEESNSSLTSFKLTSNKQGVRREMLF